MTDYLTVEQVIELHEAAAGPSPVLDLDTLTSAVMRPQAAFGGHEAHPSLLDKAAALLHGLASTQCFEDGNKRAAWIATVVFLEVNGVDLEEVSEIEAETFAMAVAVTAWSDRTVAKAAEWLAGRSARGGVPPRHPQLDFAFLAFAATGEPDGTFSALKGHLASVLVDGELPAGLSLAVVFRILWTPADVGRRHRVTAELFPDGGEEPLLAVALDLDQPTRGGHAHHPHGIMPVLVVLPLLTGIERAGQHKVLIHLDDAPLAVLPLNVVVRGQSG